jgi:hypothetical protein
VGDVVSFGAYALAGDGSAACQGVISSETAFRFELPIVAIPSPSTLELGELPDGTTRGFHPDACSAFGVVAEVRTAGTQPWMLFDGETAKGRLEPQGTFVARQRRFDYPRDVYDASVPTPSASNDVAFTFTISGGATPTPTARFSWGIASGQAPLSFFDLGTNAGLATAVHSYSSPRHPNLVFSSLTGSNEILQANPSVLASTTDGIVAYR